MYEIRLGLEHEAEVKSFGWDYKVNVSKYANPKFDARQTLQIRLGLEKEAPETGASLPLI